MFKLKRKLKSSQNVCIFPHTSPDPDCVSSAILCAYALSKRGKKPVIFTQDVEQFKSIASRISSTLPTSTIEDVQILPSLFCCDFASSKPLILMLDCSEFSRIGTLADELHQVFSQDYISRNLIIIDHHINPSPPEGLHFIDDKCSSASELCYRLMASVFHMKKDVILSRITFFGIAGDTGFFKYLKKGERSASTLSLASRLVSLGAEPNVTSAYLYKKSSQNYNKYLSDLLSDIRYICHSDCTIALIKDSLDDFEKYGKDDRPTGGLFDILFATEGIGVIVFLKYSDDLSFTECSVRVSALSAFKANEFCARFSGGGHEKAAGFRVNMNFSDCYIAVEKELMI